MPTTGVQHSRGIQVDPDNLLPPGFRDKFHALLDQFDEVFDPVIPGCKDLPLYGRDKLSELQQKFDELESLGV